ncbi:hypothetical protein Pint_29693 [Pistacia integerrima]|uniref:Uncharacterized protein n=1 Tax=Pistacia integerrima TaxID=434235 RepID=A0ACC0X097_9ROSI|nr:hypothetical protein Pint_29693 [Pistacia integerrima]
MPYITPNLRLLFSSSPFRLSLPLLSNPATPRHPLFTVLSYSGRRHRSTSAPQRNLNLQKRNKSTNERGVVPMEESKNEPSFGFNKRRAEGKDGSDKPKKNPQLKVRRLNPTNTISYVQILGTGMDTQDTSPSVLLFFDKQRFIFNAGEGLQRFCTEHKIKLSKIDHIFLSRVCSETAGGLPGLLLTLASIGDEGLSVNVWGPSDLKFLVDAMKSFIPHAAMVHTRSFGTSPSSDATLTDLTKLSDPIVLVDNEVVKISAFLLKPNCSEGSAVKPGEMSVIYVCELPELMGKFDPKKAVALGLKPGPKFSELQSGKSVKSDSSDIMVHPSDVMGPSVPGPIVLLVDCPTEAHVLELLSVESLSSYFADCSQECAKTVNCIIHLTPTSVAATPNYLKWMKRFGSAQHIMAGHEMKNVEIPILKSSARIASQLNYLCPQLFPASGFWSLQHLNNSTTKSSASKGPDSMPSESISAENLLKFTLRPHAHLGFDRTNIPSLVAPSQIMDELLSEIPEIVDAAQHENELMIEEPWLDENRLPSCLENVRKDDLEIVLLGTGSSQPSKYRNIWCRGFADNAVRNLSFIWISHIHADHHAGLARILALRRDLYTTEASWNDFECNGESNKDPSTQGSSDNNENLNHKNVVHTESNLFAKGSRMQSFWKRPGSPVDYSTAFPLLKSLKKVLSEAGLETLATFEDGMVEEAVAKNHSTTKEAIEVGSGAYRIVLTHFSQRYPKIPVVDEAHTHKTCIAFDLMSINLVDLPVLPKVLPYFKLLFKDEMPIDESDDVIDAVGVAS